MSQKIVLVTGANQGLGFEVVKKLVAEHENYLVILCSRDLKRGEEAVTKITNLAKNSKVDVLQLDVTSDESIAAAVSTVEQKYGQLDVLFNNAGIAHASGSEREAMLKVYEVNVVGVVLVTKAFLPLLMKSETKRLVIMSSDVGSITWALDPTYRYHFFQDTTYKPSKAAVNMVGAVLSNMHGKEGLKVNLVNPGLRSTSFNNYHEGGMPAEGGAFEACRMITLGNEGDVLTYTEDSSSPAGRYVDGEKKNIPW